MRAAVCTVVLACAPSGPEVPASPVEVDPQIAEAPPGDAPREAVVPVSLGEVESTKVPELPQVWRAPKIQYEAAIVDGGAGVIGRWSEYPETIVRLDARTGAEQWRVAMPNEVNWYHARAGTTHAAVWGRLPGPGGERFGWVHLADGRLEWSRSLGERTEPVVGIDGTGLGLVRECSLTVVDPATGQPQETLRGRTIGVGHSGPGGPMIDEMCATPAVLLGRVGECTAVLAPDGAADMKVVGIGAQGRCWEVPLGRVDDRVVFDATRERLIWHENATLHVGAIDRISGSMRWQRRFAAERCYPTAHLGPDGRGGDMVVVNACGRVSAVGLDGKDRWVVQATADAVVVAGEEDAVARLNDSPGIRWVQLLASDGRTTGRIEVPDRATAHATGAGVLIDTREALVLRSDVDGKVLWERKVSNVRWSAMGGYLFMTGGYPAGTLIVEASGGKTLGYDPFGATPLAVLRGEKRLVVMRAGYLWARALP